MSNRVFYYFYAPTWDYPPEGPIKLGNVLMSVKTPESPLFTAPLPSAEEVFSMDKNGVEYSAEKLREGRFSILTKFLSFLGLGVDTSVDWEKKYVFGTSPPATGCRRPRSGRGGGRRNTGAQACRLRSDDI